LNGSDKPRHFAASILGGEVKLTQKAATSPALKRTAIAAALWSFLFALANLYWGLGGEIGLETLGEGMKAMAQARDPALMLVNWVSVVGKIMLGGLALVLIRPWNSRRLRRLLQIATWAAGLLLALYGLGNAVQHALMLIGAIDIASLLGSVSAVRWHLFFWDPVWLLGGVLFLLAARQYSR